MSRPALVGRTMLQLYLYPSKRKGLALSLCLPSGKVYVHVPDKLDQDSRQDVLKTCSYLVVVACIEARGAQPWRCHEAPTGTTGTTR